MIKFTNLALLLCLLVSGLFAQEIKKELIYDQHTLPDVYPYKDTVRVFQWEKIRSMLALLDAAGKEGTAWASIQNYKNENGAAPLVENAERDEYHNFVDRYGVGRYQSAPLYSAGDMTYPQRYARDGSLGKIIEGEGDMMRVDMLYIGSEWLIPNKYIKILGTGEMNKAVFVDRTNQNISTLERVDSVWLVRSMNPTSTGLHRPPFMYETPPGIFVIQEKIPRMIYYRDGTSALGGYAPYASRFSGGAYLHGVPINLPRTEMVEFSPTLGTTPRSHMCVRNATSHALFIYNWAPDEETVVFVFD